MYCPGVNGISFSDSKTSSTISEVKKVLRERVACLKLSFSVPSWLTLMTFTGQSASASKISDSFPVKSREMT